MSVQVVIKGLTFQIPETGERDWGTEVTGWIDSISTAVSDLTVTGDIKLLSVGLSNNAPSTTVENLRFDTSEVRHAIITYSIYRVTSLHEESSMNHMYLTYKSNAGTWELVDNGVGSTGVNFTIDNTGQVKYTSTNLSGTGYSGKMSFRAQAFPI